MISAGLPGILSRTVKKENIIIAVERISISGNSNEIIWTDTPTKVTKNI